MLNTFLWTPTICAPLPSQTLLAMWPQFKIKCRLIPNLRFKVGLFYHHYTAVIGSTAVVRVFFFWSVQRAMRTVSYVIQSVLSIVLWYPLCSCYKYTWASSSVCRVGTWESRWLITTWRQCVWFFKFLNLQCAEGGPCVPNGYVQVAKLRGESSPGFGYVNIGDDLAVLASVISWVFSSS